MENCQIATPASPVLEVKVTVDVEDDSGLDNASESGGSSDDERKRSYSSSDSLETDPPFIRTSLSMRAKVQNFLDGERFYPKKDSLPPSCPHRTVFKQEETITLDPEIPEHSIAILDIDAPPVLETNNNDEPEIDFDRLPAYFQELWLGRMEPVNYEHKIQNKPSWLDDEKFKRGQKFANEHLFCINYAEMVSLYLIFGIKSALQPLIYTGRSHTPFKAFQRYLSTLTRVMTWYEGDPWCEGSMSRRNMEVVRMMHKNVYHKLTSASSEELRRRTTLGDENNTAIWSTSRNILLDDFQASCPIPPPGTCPHAGSGVWVNQYDMAVTQFAFVGLAVTFPKDFGIHHATDEDLDAFLHLWRGLGCLLGIKDQFNFCNGSLEEIRQRTTDFINLVLKPSLRDVTSDWEHMSRCLTEGLAYYVPGVTFEVSLKHVCSILKIHTPRLAKSFTYWQSFMFGVMNFTFHYMFRVPGMLAFNNGLLRKAIEKAQKASQETLSKWERKEFPYMKQNTKEPIKIL